MRQQRVKRTSTACGSGGLRSYKQTGGKNKRKQHWWCNKDGRLLVVYLLLFKLKQFAPIVLNERIKKRFLFQNIFWERKYSQRFHRVESKTAPDLE